MKYKLINSEITENYGANLLVERGVRDLEGFLNPRPGMLQDYNDLDNIIKGAQRLYKAIEDDENILLIVDSDMDGFTSAAIICGYIKKSFDKEIEFRLHTKKQHGLEDFIDALVEEACWDLVILPDAGSNDQEYHQRLMEVGADVLVIDHHEKETDVEVDNTIIINNQTSVNYRNKALTGAGMAYQFCRAMDDLIGHQNADFFLDLAAVGIIGDMGSVLEPENRYIFSRGLGYPTNNIFLRTIYKKQAYSLVGSSSPSDEKLSEAITPIGIAFCVAPLVNAVIRAGEQKEKEMVFKAMIDGSTKVYSGKRGAKGEIVSIAEEAVRVSTNARNRQNKNKEKYAEILDERIHNLGLLDNAILFVNIDGLEFPSQLNGLVCMELSKKYGKPTLIGKSFSDDEEPVDEIRGSARGLNHAEMGSFKDFLVETNLFNFASGHAEAFGYSINEENISKFHEVANERLKDINFNEGVHLVNFVRRGNERDLSEMIFDLAQYDRLWGQQNQTPLIAITDIEVTRQDIQIIGARKDTLKFTYKGITYIAFRAKKLIDKINDLCYNDYRITVVGKPNLNEWNGNFTPQIMIEDIEISEKPKTTIYEF